MRLAGEYHQRKVQEKQIPTRPITRLGKGPPNQQKRKRGISRSQDNSRISVMSLGKGEVSQEKLRELNQQSLQTCPTIVNNSQSGSKFISAACYSNKVDRKTLDYASQHLLVSPVSSPTIRFAQTLKETPFVQQNSCPFKTFQAAPTKTPSKLSVQNIIKQRFVSSRIANQQQKITYLSPQPERQLTINYIKPTHIIRNQINTQSPSKIIIHSRSSQHNDHLSNIKFVKNTVMTNIQKVPLKVPIKPNDYNYGEINIPTEKMIASKDDPYRMSGSKMTQTCGKDINYRRIDEELTTTKKTVKRALPNNHKEEITKSSANIYSKNRDSKKVTSLWDANKTQSIVSQRPSEEIKIEQSQIMINYFNPNNQFARQS